MRRWTMVAGWLCLAPMLSGCSGGAADDKPKMSRVTGTITLDGQPLETGTLVADPADKKGLPAQAVISHGAFAFEATPGPKVLRVNSTQQTGEKDEYGSPISVELIPREYNADTKLTETVAEDGSSNWKLELTSKKSK